MMKLTTVLEDFFFATELASGFVTKVCHLLLMIGPR